MDHDPNGPAGVPVLAAVLPPEPPVADAFVRRFVIEPTAPGPLRGASFAVKDLIDVAGWPTACGNPSWRATHPAPAEHAAVVRRLLDAGARLEGKTCTDELAYSLEGCNFHEGAPLNPAAPSRFTGGSSSGAASAVAAHEVDFAVGTDTAGSVRVPAAWCGLIGFRPTHGRVSVHGLTALAPDFDTVGWLARSGPLMRDIGAVLLDAGAALDRVDGDPVARDPVAFAYDPALDARGPVTDAQVGPAADAARRLDRLCPDLRALSLGIDWAAMAESLRVLQAAQVWRTHGAWIDRERPHFGPGIAERFAAARTIGADQVQHAERQRAALIARLDEVLPPGRFLRLPAVPGPAPSRDATVAERQRMRSLLLPLTALASLTGRPQLALPLGQVGGAPVGISLLGWRHGDEALLRIAAEALP